MKGEVIKLCDLESVQIPKELMIISVDTQQVEQELQNLSMRYAEQRFVEIAEEGDVVCCKADKESYPDGRMIMLYTTLGIPGAEEAVKAATGKSTGDDFTVTLCGKITKLTVEKIIRLIPAQVNDALIASIGIEGVNTVEDYRKYLTEKKQADIRMENNKMAMSYVMGQMIEGSTFEYDETDFDREIVGKMEEILNDYNNAGMKLPSEAEVREGVLYQMKQELVAKEFCRRNNIEIDLTDIEAEADQMMEMMALMGEKVPEREKMIESAIDNAYVMELFKKIEALVSEKMGR